MSQPIVVLDEGSHDLIVRLMGSSVGLQLSRTCPHCTKVLVDVGLARIDESSGRVKALNAAWSSELRVAVSA